MAFAQVAHCSATLTPDDGVLMDISQARSATTAWAPTTAAATP